jgi:hypothetical protein
MFTTLRKRLHLTPATAIAALALVFAMTGGAYAAGKYVITSTKQISPKVLKSLQGKAGAAGKPGATGAAGPAGPAGAGTAGPQGAPGTPGTVGKEGSAGKEGKQGPPGTTGFTTTLPKGSTEKGTWSAVSPPGEGQAATASISFSIPLEGALSGEHVFFVGEEEEVPECPGGVEHPEAQEGDLCVYVSFLQKLVGGNGVIHAPQKEKTATLVETGAGVGGAVLLFSQTEEHEGGLAVGTWAVTAG